MILGSPNPRELGAFGIPSYALGGTRLDCFDGSDLCIAIHQLGDLHLGLFSKIARPMV